MITCRFEAMKYLLAIVVICLTVVAYGQSQKKFSVTVQLQNSIPAKYEYMPDYQRLANTQFGDKSLAAGITFNWALSESTTLRLRTGISHAKITTGFVADIKYWINQTHVQLAPGILWSQRQNKFAFYGGFEIPINFIGPNNYAIETILRDGNGIFSHTRDEYKFLSGIAFGLGGVVGFSYHFTESFAVGAEFGNAFLYQVIDSSASIRVTDLLANTTISTDEENFTNIDNSLTSLPRYALNLSWSF